MPRRSTKVIETLTRDEALQALRDHAEASAIGLLKELKLTAFIRIKEEVDKDKILETREDAEIMQKLNTCGLKVVQDERFYIDLKEE